MSLYFRALQLIIGLGILTTSSYGYDMTENLNRKLIRMKREGSYPGVKKRAEKYDLEKIFSAFDFEGIEQDGLKAAKRTLYLFLINDFNISELKNFKFEDYETRGEFVEGLLENLKNDYDLPSDVREAIEQLLPYVRMEGPGSAPVDKKEVNLNNTDIVGEERLDVTEGGVTDDAGR